MCAFVHSWIDWLQYQLARADTASNQHRESVGMKLPLFLYV